MLTPLRGTGAAPLLRKVRGRGLLERRKGWYTRMIAGNLLALACVVTGLVLAGTVSGTCGAETGLLDCYRQGLSHMHTVGAAAGPR
ncbi:hypothetical protein [Streptomyces javensis]|uniref:hypothetical protein n=1 Tax=Streptomyces javensis TaxID=114698 RepID=UPI003F4D6B47